MELVIDSIKPIHNVYELQRMTGQQKIFNTVCEKIGLPRPIPEYKFHDSRKWRIDYFFKNPLNGVQVALEVEGGVYGYGRHNRASGFIKDMEKYNAMAEKGILLVRVIPQHLCTMKNLETLRKALKIDDEKRISG